MKCKRNIKMKICLCNKRETYFGFYFFLHPHILQWKHIFLAYFIQQKHIYVERSFWEKKLKHMGGENSKGQVRIAFPFYFTSFIY